MPKEYESLILENGPQLSSMLALDGMQGDVSLAPEQPAWNVRHSPRLMLSIVLTYYAAALYKMACGAL